MAARARRRGLRHHAPTQVRGLARDYGTHAQPAAIRLNYGMQRVHGGGNAVRADRLPALPDRRLAARAPAACCCRARAAFPVATTPRCSGPTCWPGARRAPST